MKLDGCFSKKEVAVGKPKNIVFDLVGVLFLFNTRKIVRKLGIGNLFRHFIVHRTTPIKSFFQMLDLLGQKEGASANTIVYKQYRFPSSIADAMVGKATATQTGNHIKKMIDWLDHQNYFSSTVHKKMMKKIADLMYDPASIMQYAQPNRSLCQMIEKVRAKTSGKICLLTNIDAQTLAILQKNYNSIFSLFDGIVASCAVGLRKPNPEIYQHLLQKHGLDSEESIFIDDQEENILAAKKVGIEGIQYKTFGQVKGRLGDFLKNERREAES